jgi:DNA-binding NarL/FixJ family response regulator
MALSILVIDREQIARKGLIALLRSCTSFDKIAEAPNAATAVEFARTHAVDAAVFKAQSNDDIRTLGQLHHDVPALGILVLAPICSGDLVVSAARAGCKGFLATDVDAQGLTTAIVAVAKGEIAFCREAMLHIVDYMSLPQESAAEDATLRSKVHSKPRLTSRELEVLDLVALGSSNRQIAEALVISEHTVRAHLRNILDKLRLDNRIQAAAWAARVGVMREGGRMSVGA